MTVVAYPLDAVSGAPQYTAEMVRQAMSLLAGVAPSGRPLGATSGVRPGTPTTTVTATSTAWTVNPHAGILDLEAPAAAGPVWYAVKAAETGGVTAANATNPRIDIVYVQVNDPAEGDGSSTPSVSVGYLAGTAASSPVAPSTPNSRDMVLAQISVPASGGGAPTVTWVAPTFGAVPQHYVTNTAGTSIPDSSDTVITGWTTVSSSGMGGFSGGTRTITVPGMYSIDARSTFPASVTAFVRGQILVNGIVVDASAVGNIAGHNSTSHVSVDMPLKAGDTVAITIYQNSGAAAALSTGAGTNHWSITWLGPV